MKRMLESLYSDHRSIVVVLDAMQHLVRRHAPSSAAADLRALRALLYYLDVYPERHHHPREEQCLFPAIRARTHDADEALDQLARQHAGGEAAIRHLEQLLLRFHEGGEPEWPAFAAAVDAFLRHYDAHMRLEEDVVMPIAERVIDAQSWHEIEADFNTRTDPLASVDAGTLMQHVLAMLPPPLGHADV
ncbi:MAG TPA: hemerythrin domain-containing protein [Burkholderiaceae bacterium]|nr:hemerythrin domain-containing protein [Burkholderiaceae bacterium]